MNNSSEPLHCFTTWTFCIHSYRSFIIHAANQTSCLVLYLPALRYHLTCHSTSYMEHHDSRYHQIQITNTVAFLLFIWFPAMCCTNTSLYFWKGCLKNDLALLPFFALSAFVKVGRLLSLLHYFSLFFSNWYKLVLLVPLSRRDTLQRDSYLCKMNIEWTWLVRNEFFF